MEGSGRMSATFNRGGIKKLVDWVNLRVENQGDYAEKINSVWLVCACFVKKEINFWLHMVTFLNMP